MSQYLRISPSVDEIQELARCPVPGTKILEPFIMKILHQYVVLTHPLTGGTDRSGRKQVVRGRTLIYHYMTLCSSADEICWRGEILFWECYIVCMAVRLILLYSSPTSQPLKEQCHEIFCFWFFWWISFPPAPEYCIRTVSIFFENSWR